jgi:hypothetical protein
MDLYLELSKVFGIRVTPQNFRSVVPVISAKGGFSSKQLQEIVLILIAKLHELDATTATLKTSALELTTEPHGLEEKSHLVLIDDKPASRPAGKKK